MKVNDVYLLGNLRTQNFTNHFNVLHMKYY